MEDSSLYVTEKQFYDLWSVSSLFLIKDCDFAAGEFDETLTLKVSKHSSDNFPVGTKMISNRLMSSNPSPFTTNFTTNR